MSFRVVTFRVASCQAAACQVASCQAAACQVAKQDTYQVNLGAVVPNVHSILHIPAQVDQQEHLLVLPLLDPASASALADSSD